MSPSRWTIPLGLALLHAPACRTASSLEAPPIPVLVPVSAEESDPAAPASQPPLAESEAGAVSSAPTGLEQSAAPDGAQGDASAAAGTPGGVETPKPALDGVQPFVRGIWRPGKAELDVGQGLFSAIAPEWMESLAEQGIHPFGWYMVSLQSILSGGEEPGSAYAGLFDFGVELDMQKLTDTKGVTVHASGSWTSGTNLTEEVGAFAPVNAVYSGDTLRFFEAWVQKDWDDQTWSLRAGRLSVGWEYGLDYDTFTSYLSAAFRLNMFALDANAANFSVIPYSNWGMRGRFTNDEWRVQASIMNGAPSGFADDSKHGLDIGFDPAESLFTIAEATYRWDDPTSSPRGSSSHLPGHVTFGGYYDTGEYESLDGTTDSATGLSNLYVIGRQTVWRPEFGADRGINLWSSVSYGGTEEIAPVNYFWSGGAIWNGPLASRSDDILALGFANSWFSKDLDGLTTETTLEAAYTYEVNTWLGITFDLQYILNPGGSGDVSDAWIAGALLYFTM